MSHDETLVGLLAITIGLIATVVAIGPWDRPYQLRSFSAIIRRFGKPVARGVWVAIALATFTCGLAILSGFRPDYAVQYESTDE